MASAKCHTRHLGHRKHSKERLSSLSRLLFTSTNTSSSPTQESHEPAPPWVWKRAGWDGRHLPLWGLMIRVQGNSPGTTAGNSRAGAGSRQNCTAQSPQARKAAPLRLQVTGRGAPGPTGAFRDPLPKRVSGQDSPGHGSQQNRGLSLPAGLALTGGSALHSGPRCDQAPLILCRPEGFPGIKWLRLQAPSAEGLGSIPDQGTRSFVFQRGFTCCN